MEYTVDYFIKKFEAIPEELWLVGSRGEGGADSPHCAHGWCALGNIDSLAGNEENGLIEVFRPIMNGYGVATINNGYNERYQQPTPKQRILAALYDIKKLQDGDGTIPTETTSGPQVIVK
jgi:hypothetical protein